MNSGAKTNKMMCPNCGSDIYLDLQEFVDVKENPEAKEKIMSGEFFVFKCPECGTETFIEYPVMYMDPDKKLNIYMVPAHDDDLLDQLNSLDLPEEMVDKDAVFRLTDCGEALLEKILIFDNGRDDRVIEFYKTIIAEQMREEWPDIDSTNLLYFKEDDTEFFIVWDSNLTPGSEKLTVVLDEELYKHIEDKYMSYLQIPPGKYAEVNADWIRERVDVGQ